tara:strand:- start:19 stop:660 length:642 start_codon:yes stop_codon:yes gene_type:complete
MKIIFCIPGKNFSNHFLLSWTKLIKYIESKKIEWEMACVYTPIVYKVREKCVSYAFKQDYDYIMWIDSDMVFKPSDFEKLLNHNKDIVSGLYMKKNSSDIYDIPTSSVATGMDGKILNVFQNYQQNLVKVFANGMGWMLVKKGVFESIKKPFCPSDLHEISEPFQKYLFHNGERRLLGEDYTFQLKALEQGYDSYVDTSLVVGHEKSFILGKK